MHRPPHLAKKHPSDFEVRFLPQTIDYIGILGEWRAWRRRHRLASQLIDFAA
jgi:hypothetical protein